MIRLTVLASNAAPAGLGQAHSSALRAAGGGASDGSAVGPVGPDHVVAPKIGVPLICRAHGTGVKVELLTGDAAGGWTLRR